MVLLFAVLPAGVRADGVAATRNTEPPWIWPYANCFSGNETLSFHEALTVLHADLVTYLEKLRTDQKCHVIEFYYNDNSRFLSMSRLERLAAAYAVRIGMTPQELEQATLTGDFLQQLRSTYREMLNVYIRRTEDDMVVDAGGSYTRVTVTVYLRISDELPTAWNASVEQQELFHRYCDECGEELRKLCYGTVGSAEGSIRQRVVSAALSRVGVTPYFWGEKYDELGFDQRWGFPRVNDDGMVSAYGIDCSGLVSWAFINAAGTTEALRYIGNGTSGQFSQSETIPRERVQIGDLAYRRENYNGGHIGIVVGFDTDGEPLVCNSALNVGTVVSRASDISINCYLYPAKYYEQYQIRLDPGQKPAAQRSTEKSRNHPCLPGPLWEESK